LNNLKRLLLLSKVSLNIQAEFIFDEGEMMREIGPDIMEDLETI